MNDHPALETELEKSLRDDHDGAFLRDFQRSLRDFVAAVERHTRDGLSMEHYLQWRDLQKSAEAAGELAEEIRLRLHEK
ncbi:MAG: hypothetical protein JWP91_2128 [Fibrobacteres bacterium]|nr:hypothetical protein [Fibrobacterota bacterium]